MVKSRIPAPPPPTNTRTPMPPVQAPKPAQFAMSNEDLRLAIRETDAAIRELYNGPHKTALQSHLESLLVVERDRARKINIDETTQR